MSLRWRWASYVGFVGAWCISVAVGGFYAFSWFIRRFVEVAR